MMNSGFDNNRDRSPIGNNRRGRNDSRVYVANLPYEYKWQQLKDLFRREVGEVTFVEIFRDENDKSRGCGIVEFDNPNTKQTALEKLHRFPIDGRNIIVKEDHGAPRDQYGNLVGASSGRDRERSNLKPLMRERERERLPSRQEDIGIGDTYGLSPEFLENLGISPPLGYYVFVSNLDFKVTERKLREVFKLCGRVRDVELFLDQEGRSRGIAIIEFDHPIEAVQAISMLNNQNLYDRRMNVRLDLVSSRDRNRLPEGLSGLGMGLGPNGAPLKDVSLNLPSSSSAANPLSSLAGGLPSLRAAPGQSDIIAAALKAIVSRDNFGARDSYDSASSRNGRGNKFNDNFDDLRGSVWQQQ